MQPSRLAGQETVPDSDEEEQQQERGARLANGHQEANGHEDAADSDEEEEEDALPPPPKQRKLQKSQAQPSQAPVASQRGRSRAAQLPLRTFPTVSTELFLPGRSLGNSIAARISVDLQVPLTGVVALPQMVSGDGVVGTAGQIKTVHAEDFMNHKHFEVDFGCVPLPST
jgi:hypothetical protein